VAVRGWPARKGHSQRHTRRAKEQVGSEREGVRGREGERGREREVERKAARRAGE